MTNEVAKAVTKATKLMPSDRWAAPVWSVGLVTVASGGMVEVADDMASEVLISWIS